MTESDSENVPVDGDAPADGPNPVIPWENRRRGRGFPFWKTVFWVLRRNGRIGEAMGHPVSYRESQRFRRGAIWLATLPMLICLALALAAVLIAIALKLFDRLAPADLGWSTFALLLAAAGVGLVLLTLAAWFLMTGVVSWFFCPRKFDIERQNRAIALSYYTAAPLALMGPLLFVHGIVAMACVVTESTPAIAELFSLGPLALVVYWVQLAANGFRDVTQRGPWPTAFAGLALSALWTVIVGGLLFGLPATATMWALMYLSLT